MEKIVPTPEGFYRYDKAGGGPNWGYIHAHLSSNSKVEPILATGKPYAGEVYTNVVQLDGWLYQLFSQTALLTSGQHEIVNESEKYNQAENRPAIRVGRAIFLPFLAFIWSRRYPIKPSK